MSGKIKQHRLHGHSKRVYYEQETKNNEGIKTTEIKFYNRIAEPSYFKIYEMSREMISRISFLPFGMLVDFVFLAKYPIDLEAQDGGIIDFTPRIREQLQKDHQITREHLQAILTRLVSVGFMVRVRRGSYQMHPGVCARGQWKDICRAGDEFTARAASQYSESVESEVDGQ